MFQYAFRTPLQCAVPENIHTHPKEGQWKFQGGRGSQKPDFLKEGMGLYWNFQRDGGIQTKNHPWEGYRYFLEQHNLMKLLAAKSAQM